MIQPASQTPEIHEGEIHSYLAWLTWQTLTLVESYFDLKTSLLWIDINEI